MIRQLSNDIGYTFSEMKLQVKRKTGLCFVRDKQKSCYTRTNRDGRF